MSKEAKSDRMYKDSPSIKKDEEGKAKISKPEKKEAKGEVAEKPTPADGENMGLEGNPLPGTPGEMPVDTHQAEHEELAKRHVQELKDMHKRHQADYESMNKRHHTVEKVKE